MHECMNISACARLNTDCLCACTRNERLA